MSGDLQFSFKLAGCHLKNYNNNASRVVLLSISPNREHFGYREDSGHDSNLRMIAQTSETPAMSCHIGNLNTLLTKTPTTTPALKSQSEN